MRNLVFSAVMLSAATLFATPLAHAKSSQTGSGAPIQPLKHGNAASVGVDSAMLDLAVTELQDAVAGDDIRGAVLLVARHGRVVLHQAFGVRDGLDIRDPDQVSPPMQADAIFDLESMTKPFTAFLALQMHEAGTLDIHTPVSFYLPDFGNPDNPSDPKNSVTVQELIRYTSGLDVDSGTSLVEHPDPWGLMLAQGLVYTPSQAVLYSDLAYRILGHVLETAGGDSLHNLMKASIFDPLGMSDTGYMPYATMPGTSDRWAGTAWSDTRGYYLRGEVQDEQDYYVETFPTDSVHLTGCDGLFSTAWDLALFSQMLLAGGSVAKPTHCGVHGCQHRTTSLLSPESVSAMTSIQTVDSDGNPYGLQTPSATFLENLLFTNKGYGFELAESGKWPGGDYTTRFAFSKTGGAGTLMVIDPGKDSFFILLTNHGLPDFSTFTLDEGGNPIWPSFEDMLADIRAETASNFVALSMQ